VGTVATLAPTDSLARVNEAVAKRNESFMDCGWQKIWIISPHHYCYSGELPSSLEVVPINPQVCKWNLKLHHKP